MGAAAATLDAVRLADMRVAVDVQHLYKLDHPSDRGSLYTVAGGFHVYEAQAATAYAQALCRYLQGLGASILTNNPAAGTLVGSYPARNRQAREWRADVYLACHINAGGGSYAALEYMTGSASQPLGALIGQSLLGAAPLVASYKTVPIARGQRGAVCIEGCDQVRPALIVEPFFGDNVRQQSLLAPPALAVIGVAIGRALLAWWDRRRTLAG